MFIYEGKYKFIYTGKIFKGYCVGRTMLYRSAENALSKPNISSWELESHYLVVNWKHDVDSSQHIDGYYVSLCKLTSSLCIGPDFVNFKSFVRSGRIVGLAPEQQYQLEVTDLQTYLVLINENESSTLGYCIQLRGACFK